MINDNEQGISIERCDHDGENPYAQISRSLIRDENLHPTTRFILIHLLSNSQGWKINIKQFIKMLKPHGYGKDKIYFFFQQACEVGYMKKVNYLEKGLNRVKYILSEKPKFKKCLPRPAGQDAAGQDPGETDYKKEKEFKKKHKERKNKQKDAASPEAHSLASFLFNSIKKIHDGFNQPDLNKWAKDIDLMMRVDKRTPQELKDLIIWVHKEKFWNSKVLCPTKLRKHFDACTISMNGEKNSPKKDSFSKRNMVVAQEFWDKNKNFKESKLVKMSMDGQEVVFTPKSTVGSKIVVRFDDIDFLSKWNKSLTHFKLN